MRMFIVIYSCKYAGKKISFYSPLHEDPPGKDMPFEDLHYESLLLQRWHLAMRRSKLNQTIIRMMMKIVVRKFDCTSWMRNVLVWLVNQYKGI